MPRELWWNMQINIQPRKIWLNFGRMWTSYWWKKGNWVNNLVLLIDMCNHAPPSDFYYKGNCMMCIQELQNSFLDTINELWSPSYYSAYTQFCLFSSESFFFNLQIYFMVECVKPFLYWFLKGTDICFLCSFWIPYNCRKNRSSVWILVIMFINLLQLVKFSHSVSFYLKLGSYIWIIIQIQK